MIANAMLASAVISLAVLFGLMQTCSFLVPYRAVLWHVYGPTLAAWSAVAFVNLFAACYVVSRVLFLKHTGEKLAHLERQVRSGDSVSLELAHRLQEND